MNFKKIADTSFKVIEDDPDMLYFKYSYDSVYKNASSKQLIQGRLKWTELQGDKNVSLKKASHRQMKKYLLILCKKGLIPKQHHAFFNSLTVAISGAK